VLCYIKCDQQVQVHIMCAKCPQTAETHAAGIFWHFSQTVTNF